MSISPMCDRRKPAFNFVLNAGRFALPLDGSCTTKESKDMKRLMACVIGVAPLDLWRTAAPEIPQSRSILSGSEAPNAPLHVEASAHVASAAMHLPAIFESLVCDGGNERVKTAPPP